MNIVVVVVVVSEVVCVGVEGMETTEQKLVPREGCTEEYCEAQPNQQIIPKCVCVCDATGSGWESGVGRKRNFIVIFIYIRY